MEYMNIYMEVHMFQFSCFIKEFIENIREQTNFLLKVLSNLQDKTIKKLNKKDWYVES